VVGEATVVVLCDEGRVRGVLQQVEEDKTALTACSLRLGLSGGTPVKEGWRRRLNELHRGAGRLLDLCTRKNGSRSELAMATMERGNMGDVAVSLTSMAELW
jgi:hypothetical protein